MALKHQIQIAAKEFGVRTPEDWQEVRVEWIRGVHGCGPQTIDHLRMYLAARGMTLKDDATPEFWQKNLSAARIGGAQISASDLAVSLPFTILVDTKEQQPFTFQGFGADADQDHRPLLVPIEYKDLGPTHGDYAIKGMDDCFIERKGIGDAHGTFLSHGERGERWEATLEFLAGCKTSAVVIECSFYTLLQTVQARGTRSLNTLQRTLHRQVLAWEQDYRVPFIFCDKRRMAESTALQLMRRHWRKAQEKSDKTIQEARRDADAALAAL